MSHYHAKPYQCNLVNIGMMYLYALYDVVIVIVAYKLSDVANF